MKYSRNLSVIYDAIMYGVLYFNEDRYYASMKSYGCDTGIAFEFYNKARGKFYIPDIFQPLYYKTIGEPSFLTDYLLKWYDYEKNNYADLLADKDRLYNHLIWYYFQLEDVDLGSLKDDLKNPILLSKQMKNLPVPEQLKMNLSLLFTNLDSVMKELSCLFEMCYNMAHKLHALNTTTIKALRNEIKTDTTINLLIDVLGISFSDLSVWPCGLSLLNPFMFMQFNEKMLLGLQYIEILTNWGNYDHVAIESYHDIFANEVMYSIYNILCNQDEANAAYIATQIDRTTNTVTKYLQHMFNQRAVIISKNASNDTYYALNTDYLNYGQTIRAAYLEYTKKASVESFAKLAANDIRYTAIEKLIEHGKLTSTQLGRMTKTSDAAMHKNLKILLNEGIVEIGEKTAKEIYYVINKEYLKCLKTNMEDKAVYFGQIITK